MVNIKSMKKYINPRNIILLLTLICIYPFWDYLAARIVTPIRCKMWEGKEVEIFLTPEEWRKLSGVKESLKDTKWLLYRHFTPLHEQDNFFTKNQGLYKPVMYFNGNRHSLSIVNSKYPNLNKYVYIYPETIFGHDTFILYDHKLEKVILQYNIIAGYMQSPLSGLADSYRCNDNDMSDADKLIENYLN